MFPFAESERAAATPAPPLEDPPPPVQSTDPSAETAISSATATAQAVVSHLSAALRADLRLKSSTQFERGIMVPRLDSYGLEMKRASHLHRGPRLQAPCVQLNLSAPDGHVP